MLFLLRKNSKSEQTCNPDDNTESLSNWLPMFLIAQALNGIGSIAFYTIGLTFIEDSCAPGKGAVYFGVVRMFSAIGPIFGYVGGAMQLQVWVDFDAMDESEVTVEPSDPQWVGAWWLGILVGGVMGIVCAVPMFGFPKQFPGVAQIKADRVDETLDGNKSSAQVSIWGGIKDRSGQVFLSYPDSVSIIDQI